MAALLGLTAPVGADLAGVIVPTGRQDYFVLGHEEHVWNMMQRVRAGEGGPNFQNGMNSVVSAVSSADGQVVTFDHWEDGFEADPWNPAQASTLVLGDGNAANGDACNWTNDPRVLCGADTLFRGSAVTFNSDQGLGCAAPPADQRCTVPIPRSAVDIRFDGGDRLVTSGGPLSLVHNQFPPPYPQIGGSTEVLPRQAFTGATSYSIPAGEDLYAAAGPYQMFNYTSVNIVAFDDGTQVFINSPGGTGGTASFTLNRGEHYTNCQTWDGNERCTGGGIDGAAAPAVTINASTKISATGPIAILLFSGGDGTWATDFMPILPELLHGNDYILPSPGDDPLVLTNRPLNIYTYNPDPLNAINVAAVDTAGASNFSVATGQTLDYGNPAAAGRWVPANSTVRLTSSRNFWGLAIHDHLSPANDWGYSWLATDFLTRNYTVSYAPGLSNPAGSWPTCGASPLPAPGACNSLNRSAVFVAASLDFTLVKIDFDNDGVFDIIDVDSDDHPDDGAASDSSCGTEPVTGFSNCLYRVDALQTLRIFDYTDYDNTGTRVQASKPIAVAYGQDTDQATGPDAILDTGYTVYPLSQRFLDPVLVAGKAVSPTVVPGDTGGRATFTITARSYAFTPLTNMVVSDLLPAGLTQADYEVGSTLITYPNLSQRTDADPPPSVGPTFSVDPGGRTRLTWDLDPEGLGQDTMGQDQTLTVRFTLNIPPGAAQTFANEAFVSGTHGGRAYNAVGGADVVRSTVALGKAVDESDGGPGDVLTYTLDVANNGLVAETAVVLTDPIPPGTTFVTGSVNSAAPFSGVYDAAQNAVVWTAATFARSASAQLSFQVTVNADTAIGRVLLNTGIFESNATPTFFSNDVSTTVVGPRIAATKTIVGGVPPVLHPGELAAFEVQVRNNGASAATNVTLADPLADSNTTYVTGTMEMSLNGGAFTALTDASGDDAGTLTGTTLDLSLTSLAPQADVRFRFQARVDAVLPGEFVNNQATVSASEVGTTDTNLVQVPVDGDATITGHVFLDSNGDGNQDAGEPDLANISVLVTDSDGITQSAVTDAGGDYSVVVPAGNTALEVDETDPDLPQGAILTTSNNPQTVLAVSSATTPSGDVGYDLPPLTIIKTSDAGGTVLPGQTVTYTVAITNNESTTLSGIAVTDAEPAGTAYVGGTVSGPALRVTEYHVGATTCGGGPFTGTTCDITLADALLPDYFAIVQGADGTGGNNGTSPDDNHAALTADPFGTGGLAALGPSDVVRLSRGGTSAGGYSWEGVVTVVECLGGCDTDGFRLLDVQRIGLPTGATAATETGTATSTTPWTDLSRVVLFGAANGAGCDTTDGSASEHQICALRLSPSGTQTIDWQRQRSGDAGNFASATATVMVVQWGSSWDVYGRTITGGAGGGGAAVAANYDTATIPSVARDQTWVWGSGSSSDNGLGDGPEGTLITLGDGETQLANETLLAAGSEYTDSRSVHAYALTHPGLAVDYRFKADGDSGAATVNVAVDAAGSQRMALVTNGCNGTGTAYARPMFSARYLTATTVELQRRRTGQPFPAWVQGIDFSNVTATAPAGTPPTIVDAADGWSLPPGETMTITYEVVVTADVSLGLTEIENTASVTAAGVGSNEDAATDILLFLGVEVEPNNAGYALPDTTITFTHTVLNTGTVDDAYSLSALSGLPWMVELIDPDTGVVIATDSDGNGTWDLGVTPNTGTLAPGTFREYELRVSVPAGTAAGTLNTVILTGVSSHGQPYSDDAEDEITVLDPVVVKPFGEVVVTPDNSGIVRTGSSVAYSHLVINNHPTEPDTFDLATCSSRLPDAEEDECPAPYAAPIYWDTNGDGVYTEGTDLQISNTAQLPPGGSQLIFVVIEDWGGAPGDVDITHITATSRRDPDQFGAATDTTTFVDEPDHDLSGGGTRVVDKGDISVHPGTLVNLSSLDDRYNLDISVSNLYQVDTLLHPTELWADADGDGSQELVAVDTDGDGNWNVVNFDTDGNGEPDVPVPAGDVASYELRRAVDPSQELQRDHVTLTSDAINGPTVKDSVTATWVFAAATRAGIRGVRADPEGTVSFVTATQADTAWFVVYETDDPSGLSGRKRLHDEAVVSPVPDSLTPILYRVPTGPITMPYVVIEETETDGDVVWGGPFLVSDRRLRLAFDTIERLMDEAGIPYGPVQRTRGMRPLSRAAAGGASSGAARGGAREDARSLRSAQRVPTPQRRAASGAKINVHQPGRVAVTLDALTAAGLPPVRPGSALVLQSRGRVVPYAWEQDGGAWSVVFQAEELSTDFTGSSVYVATARSAASRPEVPLTVSGDPGVPGFTRVERNALYIPSLPDGPDPWQWDLLFTGWPWPDPGWDPAAGDFDLPGLLPGASGDVAVRIRLVGYTHHSHSVTATINGLPVGSLTFDGAVEATLEGSVDAGALHASGNKLSLTYVGTDLPESPATDAMGYLDYVDLAIPTAPVTTDAPFDLSAYDPSIPRTSGVEYLVVTHPLFRAQADRVAALKHAEGMRALVVETDSAYDRFSGGIVEPRAIQALIRSAFQHSGALRFVLLVGDDTFDPRDHVGIGSRSFVPTLYARDASWGLVPSETPFADVDDDGKPDLAIGRLPVHTAAEAEAVVDKIAAQASALTPLLGAQLVVSDNASETDAPFRAEAENALRLLPASLDVRWSDVSHGTTDARDVLLQGWSDGVLLTHYFGHGGLTEWADEQVLTRDDVDALGASWKPTVLFAWACLSQWYVGIDGPSLNEALILQPTGGAVASFGPAGITSPAKQGILVDALYRELARPGVTLGEAIRNAKILALEVEPDAREVIEGFHLFGDPSLQIPWPAPVLQ